MLITVAVCTWNRSALLRETLTSLAAARVPAGLEWETIVVDNNCTDDTAAVIAEAAATVPLRVVNEPALGLSHARNAAVHAAAGRYIVWVDDDVLVEPEWLAAYAEAFEGRPDVAFFGGPIRPRFAAPPPPWLIAALPSVGNALSLIDFGHGPFEFDDDHLPFGANFAIRTDIQRRHLYDPELGRRGGAMRSGEETAVLHGVLAEGGRGLWVPRAALAHYVGADRQTRRYLRRYYFNNGAAHALDGYPNGGRRFLGRPLWIWRNAVENELCYQFTRLFASPAVWGGHLRHATTSWGQLYGADARRYRQRSDAHEDAQPSSPVPDRSADPNR